MSSALTATCYCGRVRVTVRDDDAAAFCSLCHCSVCRRLSGAPAMCSVVLPSSTVAIDGDVTKLATSKHVTRFRCAHCASPVGASLGRGKQRAVPLALFGPDAPWKPMHHIHYSDRVFDVHDDLPKFAGRYGGPRCDAAGEDAPTSAAAAAAGQEEKK